MNFEPNTLLFSSHTKRSVSFNIHNTMFNPHRYRTLLHFNLSKFYPLSPLHLGLKFCTTTSASEPEPEPEPVSDSFTVPYLINTLGFTPKIALKISKRLRFTTPHKPDSVFAFFKTHGFSDSNIRHILTKEPYLLTWDPHKSILPKLLFFLSKTASPSDVVSLLTANPRILQRSLNNHIIPLYELLHRFKQSDKDTVACIIRHSIPLSYNLTQDNIKLMIDFGVCDSGIARLLVTRPSILGSSNLLDTLEEVKGLGFDPSKIIFAKALLAKKAISKTRWDEKVEEFKKWGWSCDDVLQAFRAQPDVMLTSSDKIGLVMDFWVNEMGWNALALVKGVYVLGYSFQRRIVPRAAVMQVLLSKGLRGRVDCLISAFSLTEKLFLRRYVLCFKEESSFLLNLYHEKLNLDYTMEKTED